MDLWRVLHRCVIDVPETVDQLLVDLPTIHDESPVLPAAVLEDDDWLRARLEDTSRRWGSPDPRVNATLWWYSASATLLGPAAASLLLTGTALAPAPEVLTLRRNGHVGYLARVRPKASAAPGVEGLGEAMLGLKPLIDRLARLGGVSVRSLASVTSDALAGRLLFAARALGDDDAAVIEEVAADVAAASAFLPRTRLSEAGRPPFRYVRRGSCCLIYRTPEHAKCSNCPRQTPQLRAERVASSHHSA